MAAWPYILTCIFAWGLWGVVQRLSIRHASPMMVQVIAAYVFSIVGPALFLYMKATGQKTEWNAPGILWTTLASLLVVVGGLAFSNAVSKGSVGGTVGLTSAYPVVTLALSWLILGEPITLRKAIGIAIVSIGIIVLGW